MTWSRLLATNKKFISVTQNNGPLQWHLQRANESKLNWMHESDSITYFQGLLSLLEVLPKDGQFGVCDY